MGILEHLLAAGERHLKHSTRPGSLILGFLFAYIVFWLLRAIYRLTFRPLSSFPGPKAAAISVWWLYRQDKSRHVESMLKTLHKTYDTHILRIGPNELHIDNVTVYDEIYSSKYRFIKEPAFYAQFNAPNTVFSEVSPALHRERRKIVNPFFSKQGIASVQSLIDGKVNLMIDKIREFQDKGAIHLYSAIRCLTVDIISEYAFGDAFGLLQKVEDNKFRPDLLYAFDLVLEGVLNYHYFPVLRIMSNLMPQSIAAAVDYKIAKFLELRNTLEAARSSFMQARANGTKFERLPLFEPLSSLPDDLVLHEAVDIIIAGSDTTATSLGNLINFVLGNPDIKRKLTDELHTALPGRNADWPLAELERLEYLTACIKETLRCGLPVQGRLPRIVPYPEAAALPFVVDGKVIPPGTIVGMSATTVHHAESIWGPDYEQFKPERWLEPESKRLEKYLVTFSKGARQCIGINLVYAELRIATSKLFRRFDMSLDSSMTKKDLNQLDCFTTSFEGTGVRVWIQEARP